jgi:hypothetical protein
MTSPIPKMPIPPAITTVADPTIGRILVALKQNVELINGVQAASPVLTQLPASASLAQVITMVNTIIQRLNYQGQ